MEGIELECPQILHEHPTFNILSFIHSLSILLHRYLASCGQADEGSPRQTSECQGEGVTDAKREGESVEEKQNTS